MSGVTVEADGQRCQGESRGLNERSMQAVTQNVSIYKKITHRIVVYFQTEKHAKTKLLFLAMNITNVMM